MPMTYNFYILKLSIMLVNRVFNNKEKMSMKKLSINDQLLDRIVQLTQLPRERTRLTVAVFLILGILL